MADVAGLNSSVDEDTRLEASPLDIGGAELVSGGRRPARLEPPPISRPEATARFGRALHILPRSRHRGPRS
jgi:hypothetical protein